MAESTCEVDCPVLVSADPPSLFQGYKQPDAVTLFFSGPAGSVTVVGDGAIQCSGEYGTLIGYDASGIEVGRKDLQLINQYDCSTPDNPDNVTYGAQATLETPVPMATAVILPMSPLEFLVLGECCGHASATYAVTVDKGSLTEIGLTCSGAVLRGGEVTCTASPKDPTDTLVVTGWNFTSDDGFRVDRQLDVSSTSWSGRLAVNGKVTVAGTVDGGAAQSVPVSVSVTDRNWEGKITTKDHAIVSPSTLPVHPTAFNGHLGLTGVDLVLDVANQSQWAFVINDSGPNDGFMYLTNIPYKTLTRPQVNTNALVVGSDFWELQYPVQTKKKGVPYCGRDFVTGIIPLVEAHEGYDPETQPLSHAGIYRRHVDSLAYLRFEDAAGPESSPIFESRRLALHREAFVDDSLMDDDSRNNINRTTMPCDFNFDWFTIPE